MNNAVLTSPEQISDFFESIVEDFKATDFSPGLLIEQDNLAYLHETYFSNQAGPDGSAWAPISKEWAEFKGHDTILIWTGALHESLTVAGDAANSLRQITRSGQGGALLFGTLVPYSRFHDPPEGDESRTKKRIPIRRHIGMTETYVDAATNRVVDYSLAQLAKGA